MRMVNLATWLLSVACMLLAHSMRAEAVLMSQAWPLDAALETLPSLGGDRAVVVAGRIVSIEGGRAAFSDANSISSAALFSDIHFQVTDVLLGDQNLEGELLVFERNGLEWPSILVPKREGIRCILILHPELWANQQISNSILAVVPAHREHFETQATVEGLKRVLVHELLAELKEERDEARRQELISQVQPIMTHEEAQELAPFLHESE